MYVVVRSGGQQHRMKVGDLVRVASLPGDVGSPIVFDEVLLVGEGESIRVGNPVLDDVKVRGTVVEQGLGPKILVYNFKKRKNSNRKRRGHRQGFTAVKIEAIDA